MSKLFKKCHKIILFKKKILIAIHFLYHVFAVSKTEMTPMFTVYFHVVEKKL